MGKNGFLPFSQREKSDSRNVYKCNNLHLALANAGRFHQEIKCKPNLAFSRTDKCVCLQNKQFYMIPINTIFMGVRPHAKKAENGQQKAEI